MLTKNIKIKRETDLKTMAIKKVKAGTRSSMAEVRVGELYPSPAYISV